jgi:hypothetical protein
MTDRAVFTITSFPPPPLSLLVSIDEFNFFPKIKKNRQTKKNWFDLDQSVVARENRDANRLYFLNDLTRKETKQPFEKRDSFYGLVDFFFWGWFYLFRVRIVTPNNFPKSYM